MLTSSHAPLLRVVFSGCSDLELHAFSISQWFLIQFQIQFMHFHCDILDLVHFQLLLLF